MAAYNEMITVKALLFLAMLLSVSFQTGLSFNTHATIGTRVTMHAQRHRLAMSNNGNSRSIPLAPTARRPLFQSGSRYRSDDWLRNFLSMPNSFVLRRIRFHLLSNTCFCALVLILQKWSHLPSIPIIGHSLLGGFLSLLLVFRTNSAYARFWEGRGVWTKCMTTCRNLALNVVNYMTHTSPQCATKFLDALQDFPEALSFTCLSTTPSTDSLEPALELCAKMHLMVHQAASEATKSIDYFEAQHLTQISHHVDDLVHTVSACETLFKTPVPLSYSRHTSRFLTLWCGTLPLALKQPLGNFPTLCLVFVASWCLLGIEEIGHLIEQPFVRHDDDNDESPSAKQCSTSSKTQPYDIGLPVHILAREVKKEIERIRQYADESHTKLPNGERTEQRQPV